MFSSRSARRTTCLLSGKPVTSEHSDYGTSSELQTVVADTAVQSTVNFFALSAVRKELKRLSFV